ncbi:MAG TPA: deoxyhypusine synthase family protein [Methanocorpusculum sp.]|nr:deoxyhypusine synthase family protein [Candidatus Methanocorpusculum equi]MCQ2357551.1 deoxyhypusine synthase family protein [Methanocorpusculum sp.]HJJ33357.1 deoxyhypusine synthase family protein [Methanocorpusculum sp.]HJJ44781.1 deoxyhypusine synthase family protein [Methanocorpusculum sp.]HJJ58313.1 deoxyhypusine synthase family protein [Methanocorpusculum sp.]
MFDTPTNPMKPAAAVDELLMNMSKSGFQGRKLGEAFRLWKEMIETPGTKIIIGLSGAIIPAGMQECILTLLENHYIDCIVSTGANMFHDFCEHMGVKHYVGSHLTDDAKLHENGINRIYDVYASEKDAGRMEEYIAAFGTSLGKQILSSREFFKLLGDRINKERPEGRSIVGLCAKLNIPIHVPAIADLSYGIGLVYGRRTSGCELVIDQVKDADELSEFVELAGKTGIVLLGGGTPKNFIQQTEVIPPKYQDKFIGGHSFALQITTDAPHWGGLSGCTFEEGVSWGKEKPETHKLQCFCDITIALPILVSALVSAGVKRA